MPTETIVNETDETIVLEPREAVRVKVRNDQRRVLSKHRTIQVVTSVERIEGGTER